MRITVSVLLLLGLVLRVQGDVTETKDEDESYLNCLLRDNTVGCLRTRLGKSLDEIEVRVTGKDSETPMSAVIEQAGNFVAEVIDDVQNPRRSDEVAETADAGEQGENQERELCEFHLKKRKRVYQMLDICETRRNGIYYGKRHHRQRWDLLLDEKVEVEFIYFEYLLDTHD
ncbi:hypothetical protein K0M31_019362 [Melipona bicolor]|uniref:Uncharacterized protein n=1 Tax=Melipona bicolor TaxID=60889 RepID=A0AA40G2A9_9HYME|nr:hypothetical protein K0M31_019362 [Melipona bicolor]